MSFAQFAGLFVSILTGGVGLIGGAYSILSKDLSSTSAIALSGVTAFVIIATLVAAYNRLTIERFKRREQ
jgi:uncharacterized membrane protein YoaK (UPF0700 family)